LACSTSKATSGNSSTPTDGSRSAIPSNDFYTLPLAPVKDANGEDLKVSVKLPTGDICIQVWKLDVGRITLYLLDTNIPDNVLPQDRGIADSLYGGDIDTRIRQEIVLGIGGMRALKAMGLKPTVYHMNEGHSAFLALEQVRVLMRDQETDLRRSPGSRLAPAMFSPPTRRFRPESICSTPA
jgi:starch phosphorylase